MKLLALAIALMLLLLGGIAGGSAAISLIEHRLTQLENLTP